MIKLQTDTDLFGAEISSGATIDRAMLAAGLYANLKDISLEEFVSYFINPFEATLEYVNLCAGAKAGQRISMLFNPHRLDVAQKSRPNTLYSSLRRPDWCNNLARVVMLNNAKRDILYTSIGIGVGNVGFLQDFPPHVARDLAKEYNLTTSSHVLDPCAGWGGRMIGFSAVVDSYTCCEPSTRTAAGLRKLYDWLRVFRSDFSATIHEAPFEDVEIQSASFDFALTSPPYYDTERYADEPTNSFKRYTTFDAWCHGFYAPLIHRTMAALKPGASFVLNIGSRVYPLNEQLMKIAEGRYVVEKLKGRLSASNGLGKDGEGETFYEIRNPAGTVYLQTVKHLTDATAPILAVAPPATSRTSALDFALNQREPDAVSGASETSPQDIADGLAGRGHRLLTRDGKFFVSNASALTAEDRAHIAQHRAELIALAEGYTNPPANTPDVSLFERPAQTLAQFLGSEPPRVDPNYTPDEPPDLAGIDDIVLNFATDGLDWAHGHRPIGVTVSTLDGQLTRFLPFRFRSGNLDEAVVKRWAQEQLRGKHITNANTRFDVHMAREWGVDLEEQGCTVSDVMHYAALLDDHRKTFALDVLATDYLKEPTVDRVDERNHASYTAAEVDARERYSAQTVAKLRHVMWPLLDAEDLQQVRQLEDEVIYPVVEMEKNGALIDVELLERYSAECTAAHGALMMEIASEAGFAFDHTASGWQRLFEKCGLVLGDSHAESVIGIVDHPLIKKAHYAGQIASLNSKTFAAYRKNLDGNLLHYDINQLRGDDGGTVSGRFSIGYVQQVPNHDNHSAVFGEQWFPRRLFVPASGTYLEADAAQIEYRLFAHFAGNEKVFEAYRADPWASFHKMTWEMMKQHKPNMLYTHQKNFNFAKMYGARLVKLATMMGFITEKEAEEIRSTKRWTDARLAQIREIESAYARIMPEGDKLLDRAAHLAKTKCDDYCKRGDALHRQYPHRGYVKTLLGRRSRFPTNYKTYIGLNRVLQGTAADVMKRKLVELHRERKQTGFLMRLTVHDAVGGDAQEPETMTRVEEILNRQSFDLKVPILWACKQGANWAEAK